MVLIGQRPIVWHIMKLYAHHGYRDFVLCLGYRGQMIKEYFLNYEAMNNDFTIHLGSKTRIDYLDTHDEQNFRVTLADTGQETMTGGRIKRIQRHIDGDTFMVTYGDGVSDVDIGELLKFHRSHGRLATVTAMQPPSRFGMLAIADDGRVTRFAGNRKPTGGPTPASSFSIPGFSTTSIRISAFSRQTPGTVVGRRPAHGLPAPRLLLRHGYLSRVPAPEWTVERGKGTLEGMVLINRSSRTFWSRNARRWSPIPYRSGGSCLVRR